MIHDLQNQSQARIKLSQSNDFFPGTQDRTVFVTGEPEAVQLASELILQRIQADTKPREDGQADDQAPQQQSVSELMLVRIVVPSAAAGAIIGRAGQNINELKEMTGARIKLTRKDESSVPSERLVNIHGSLESCNQVVREIIHRLAADDLHRYQNMTTSYSRMMASMTQNAMTQNTMESMCVSRPRPFLQGPRRTRGRVLVW